jgi:MFS family permease
LGFSGEQLLNDGIFLLNVQMVGMLLGGIAFGILGDRLGRVVLVFGSILLYSVANIANGFVHSVEAYAVWRFIAGFGLAGELGGGITLVSEVLSKEARVYGTMIVSAVGVFGAVVGALIANWVQWKTFSEIRPLHFDRPAELVCHRNSRRVFPGTFQSLENTGRN